MTRERESKASERASCAAATASQITREPADADYVADTQFIMETQEAYDAPCSVRKVYSTRCNIRSPFLHALAHYTLTNILPMRRSQ